MIVYPNVKTNQVRTCYKLVTKEEPSEDWGTIMDNAATNAFLLEIGRGNSVENQIYLIITYMHISIRTCNYTRHNF